EGSNSASLKYIPFLLLVYRLWLVFSFLAAHSAHASPAAQVAHFWAFAAQSAHFSPDAHEMQAAASFVAGASAVAAQPTSKTKENRSPKTVVKFMGGNPYWF
ncbi:MAG: hypothetical protein AAGL98_10500, partial [Planctomycetota bacterium]